MGWFDRLRGAQEQPPQVEERNIECFRTIDTEGLDLSQPFVDDYISRGTNYVWFGENNLYPQILNQLYISAPMHQACVNFKKYSLIGNGYEWDGYDNLSVAEKIAIKQFETMSSFKKNLQRIALDWIKHGRVIALLKYDKEHKRYSHFKIIDPENIRNVHVGLFNDKPTHFFYSKDWARSTSQLTMSAYRNGNTDEWQVIEIRNEVGGFRSYGMPDWVSSANWQKVGADIALLHKSAIENGIQPSVIYKYPYIMSPDERSTWEQGMRKNAKGAKNYGRAMKVESLSKDQQPDIDVVSTTDNHALFEQTSKEYKEEVAISHNLNPALMGVRVAGSLGASEEIEFSAEQFKKLWVNSNREVVEDFVNDLASICGVTQNITIKETDILTVKEVLENGGKVGVQSENLASQTQVQTNDNLKGLSAKDNMDMMRIMRDFSKGRLAEPLARTRLAAYGIDEDTINTLLTAE
jgi:hypothetical protein